jgi:hypothetical protein
VCTTARPVAMEPQRACCAGSLLLGTWTCCKGQHRARKGARWSRALQVVPTTRVPPAKNCVVPDVRNAASQRTGGMGGGGSAVSLSIANGDALIMPLQFCRSPPPLGSPSLAHFPSSLYVSLWPGWAYLTKKMPLPWPSPSPPPSNSALDTEKAGS